MTIGAVDGAMGRVVEAGMSQSFLRDFHRRDSGDDRVDQLVGARLALTRWLARRFVGELMALAANAVQVRGRLTRMVSHPIARVLIFHRLRTAGQRQQTLLRRRLISEVAVLPILFNFLREPGRPQSMRDGIARFCPIIRGYAIFNPGTRFKRQRMTRPALILIRDRQHIIAGSLAGRRCVGHPFDFGSFNASALRLMARTAIELHRFRQRLPFSGVPRPIGFRDLTERPNGLMIAVVRCRASCVSDARTGRT